ncbi:hypothetical protein ABPG74_012282 [Tetrahymena malaccensis]
MPFKSQSIYDTINQLSSFAFDCSQSGLIEFKKEFEHKNYQEAKYQLVSEERKRISKAKSKNLKYKKITIFIKKYNTKYLSIQPFLPKKLKSIYSNNKQATKTQQH